MQTITTVVHIVTAFLLVVVVLLQAGKGAEISASFGGSSQTVFGTAGGANFFTRFTSGLAFIFVVSSVLLTRMNAVARTSVMEGLAPSVPPAATQPVAPAQPAAPAEKAAPAAPARK